MSIIPYKECIVPMTEECYEQCAQNQMHFEDDIQREDLIIRCFHSCDLKVHTHREVGIRDIPRTWLVYDSMWTSWNFVECPNNTIQLGSFSNGKTSFCQNLGGIYITFGNEDPGLHGVQDRGNTSSIPTRVEGEVLGKQLLASLQVTSREVFQKINYLLMGHSPNLGSN